MKAWTSAERAPATTPHTIPHPPVLQLVRAEEAEERAHQQHPLETDVHDAAPLREDPAERRERQRRRARSVAAISADHTKTWSSDSTFERVRSSRAGRRERQPRSRASRAAAPTPSRREIAPATTPRPPTTSGTTGERAVDRRECQEERERPSPTADPREHRRDVGTVDAGALDRCGAHAQTGDLLPTPDALARLRPQVEDHDVRADEEQDERLDGQGEVARLLGDVEGLGRDVA